ncbi:MAG TPA: GntR family transcriptional regulator, partial [Sphingomonas sp.]|nr:GntR family transcriptional regulator [Sphingomonas sp.]
MTDNQESAAVPHSEESAEARTAPGADDLAHALRLQIQKSELAPGEWLREARLCSEFGVGRSIVRRAL